MTKEELKRLEMNLTKSDAKAKPGYLRGKHGLLPEDQSFMPLDWVPLFTYKEGKPIKMAEFIEDYKELIDKHTKLAVSHASLQNEYQLYKEQENQRHLELDKKLKEMEDRIKAFEIFSLD